MSCVEPEGVFDKFVEDPPPTVANKNGSSFLWYFSNMLFSSRSI
jgi:hypothetical protein